MTGSVKASMGNNCYLSIGANLGDREKTLRKALRLISELPVTEIIKVSSFYETEPWGVKEQPNFINGAVHIRTCLSPLELLKALQSIEYALGRVRKEHWGARTIDIDIIHIDGVRMESEELNLPHPFFTERLFVLIPLAEIIENVYINKYRVKEYLDSCSDDGIVRRAGGSPMDFNLCLLVCVDSNWALGREGKLLFHFPEDMRRFRDETLGNTVIMGRKTFESFPGGKPLNRRKHIILSRKKVFSGEYVNTVSDIEELWEILDPFEKNYVIGGAEIYEELLPYCKEAHITFVFSEENGDCFFPDLGKRYDFGIYDSHPFMDVNTGISMEFRKYRRK